MIYKIKYNPELTAIFKEEIIAAFSPSLVSHDKEEPTGVFSLDVITDYLDRKLLVTATEQDVVEINTLIEEEVSYIEIFCIDYIQYLFFLVIPFFIL